MKSKMLIICTAAVLMHAAGGCVSFNEEDPMPPDAKIIPAPASDSKAVESAGPQLSRVQTAKNPEPDISQFVQIEQKNVKQTAKTTKKQTASANKGVAAEQKYTVKNGDSYWKIGRAYGVSWKEIQTVNKNVQLRPGITIIIPAGASKTVSNTKATPKKSSVKKNSVKKSSAKTAAADSGTVYIVKSGDSFSRIAKRHGVRAADIAALNGLQLTSMLQIGQKLKIPARGTKVAKNTKSAKTPAKTAAKTPAKEKKAAEDIAPKPLDEGPAVPAAAPDGNVPPAPPAVPGEPAVPGAPAAPAAVPASAPAVPAAASASAPAAPVAVPQAYDTRTDKDGSFEELAKSYGCTASELKQLNPQIRGNIVPKGTAIKLP